MCRRTRNNEEKPGHWHVSSGVGCDRHCPRYEWWCRQRGKTVRVTQGAFTGLVGRLHAFWVNSVEVVYHASGTPHSVQIAYTDLEVVNEGSCNH